MSMSTQSFLGLIKYKNTLGLATLGFGTVQGGGGGPQELGGAQYLATLHV